MRTRLTAAALAAAAALALAGCSSSSSAEGPKATTPAATETTTDAAMPTLPPAPTGAKRTAYLAAISAVDPSLTDSERVINAGRDQCQALDDGAQNTDHLAAQRFGTGDHPLTDTQGKALNAALRATLCPKG